MQQTLGQLWAGTSDVYEAAQTSSSNPESDNDDDQRDENNSCGKSSQPKKESFCLNG